MKYLLTMPVLIGALLIMYWLQAPAAGADGFAVDTLVAETRLQTEVDSELARELLLQPERFKRDDITTLGWPTAHCHSDEDLPDTDVLARITHAHSPDTATALLLRCLERLPGVSYPQRLFRQALDRQRSADAGQTAFLHERAQRYKILFVPGWGYRSSGDATGSDMRIPRQIISAYGFESHLVELPDYGDVEGNARHLAAALRQHLLSDNKMVLLVSASSGGPAVAQALSEPDLFGHPQLAGWLNICGVLRGSPVVDLFTDWPRALLLRLAALFEGWTVDEILSLSRRHSRPRFDRFRAPETLTVLNYIGVPFSAQVSDMGRHLHRMLRPLGPNDGLTLITDALAPGYTILAPGSDHFIREDPDIDLKTAALLPVMLRLIDEKG